MALKDNKIYRWIAIPICIALCFIGRFIPPFGGLTRDAVSVLFIFLGSLILWLTIGIDWPSLITLFALGFLDNMGFSKVFTSSFGNATWLFLLFTFVCTYALSKTSLIKRVAVASVSNRLARKNGYLFMALFFSVVLLLGLFIAPTVLFVVILPILEEIFAIAKIEKGERIGKVMLMGLGFTVSISSGMTTIAHVFPVLAMNAARVNITPWQYMAMAVPAGLVLFGLMICLLFFFAKPEVDKLKGLDVSSIRNEIPPVGARDIAVLSIFAVVVLLWIVPSIFKDVSPDFYNAINKYGTAMPPLLGAIALCIIRIDGKPLVKIDDAFKNGVPWGSLIMCAATLALGVALTDETIGLKAFLQNNIGAQLASAPWVTILIVFALWAALQTNLSSNMVTATLVATVAASVIGSGVSDINLPALVAIIGMLASFAFATPPSMPHIAIIAADERCSTKDVLLYGGALMILSIAVACLVAYPLGMLVM